jgi:hypothetical protein
MTLFKNVGKEDLKLFLKSFLNDSTQKNKIDNVCEIKFKNIFNDLL